MEQPQTNNDLRVLFDSFDKDKSGTIEKGELKNIALQLGHQIPQKQLADIMDAIDLNGDGKISFKQFKKWWRQGIQGKMQRLVILQWKAFKHAAPLKQFLKQASLNNNNSEEGSKIQAYTYSTSYGDKKQYAESLLLQLFVGGDKFVKKTQQLGKQYIGFNPSFTNITISLYIPKAQQLKALIDKMMNQINNSLKESGLSIESYFKINLTLVDKNCLKICVTSTQITQPFVQELNQPLVKYTESFGKEFFFYIKRKIDFTTKNNQLQSFLEQLKNGFKFQFQLETTKNMIDMIKSKEFIPQDFQLLKEKNVTKIIKTQQQLKQFQNLFSYVLFRESKFQTLFIQQFQLLVKRLTEVLLAEVLTMVNSNKINDFKTQYYTLLSGQQVKAEINVQTNVIIFNLCFMTKDKKKFIQQDQN